MISCFSFGFLAPYLIFDRREKFSNLVKKLAILNLILIHLKYKKKKKRMTEKTCLKNWPHTAKKRI